SASGNDTGNKLRERLESLRVQLSHLLGSHTEEHPEIVTLKSQISSLERQLGLPQTTTKASDGVESIQQTGGRQTGMSAPQDVRQASGELDVPTSRNEAQGQLTTELNSAMSELAKSSRQRQA